LNESRYYSNGVRNEVYQLQSVVVQKAAEEISRWEVEAALKEGTKDDLLLDVLARELFPSGGPVDAKSAPRAKHTASRMKLAVDGENPST
jgi:hypothetical protein